MREATYCFGDVEVEPGGRELRRGGARVALEPKALDVLLVLLRDAGRVVDKRRLLAEVWADVHVSDSSLARAVTQIRRALGDDITSPRYIETVPTRGYRFIGTLEPATPETPTVPVSPAAGRAAGGEMARPSGRWALGTIRRPPAAARRRGGGRCRTWPGAGPARRRHQRTSAWSSCRPSRTMPPR